MCIDAKQSRRIWSFDLDVKLFGEFFFFRSASLLLLFSPIFDRVKSVSFVFFSLWFRYCLHSELCMKWASFVPTWMYIDFSNAFKFDGLWLNGMTMTALTAQWLIYSLDMHWNKWLHSYSFIPNNIYCRLIRVLFCFVCSLQLVLMLLVVSVWSLCHPPQFVMGHHGCDVCVCVICTLSKLYRDRWGRDSRSILNFF